MSSNDPSTPIDVDLTRSTSGVWLVKMPKYLSKILNDYGDAGINGEVGRLIKRPQPQSTKGTTAAATGGRAQDVCFSLNEQIMEKLRENSPEDFKMTPREHRFCLSNLTDGVLRTVYTRTLNNSTSSTGEQISIVGKVIQRAEVRPVESEQYMSMKRKHFEMSQEPTRRAQRINKKGNTYAPKRDHEANKERNRLKKLAGKRVRSSEDAVLNNMFEAFSKHQFISLSSLEVITNQPKSYLQQLVKKYCNYNSSGHTYELKPQFRHYNVPKEEEDEEEDDIEDDDDDDDDDEDNNNNNNNDNA